MDGSVPSRWRKAKLCDDRRRGCLFIGEIVENRPGSVHLGAGICWIPILRDHAGLSIRKKKSNSALKFRIFSVRSRVVGQLGQVGSGHVSGGLELQNGHTVAGW